MPNGSTPFSEESTPHLSTKNLNSKPQGAIALSQGRGAGIPHGSTKQAPKTQRIRARRRRGGRARARNGRDLISRADSAAHGADQESETTNRGRRGYTGRGGERGWGALTERQRRGDRARSAAARSAGSVSGGEWRCSCSRFCAQREGQRLVCIEGADGPASRSAWAHSPDLPSDLAVDGRDGTGRPRERDASLPAACYNRKRVNA
jgi:hypothetical protein